MNFFKSAITVILKKPFIFVYAAIISFFIALIGLFNPFSSLLKLYSNFITDSVTDTIVILSKEVYKIGVIPYAVLMIILFSVISGILAGIIYSGYFNLVFKSIKKIKAFKKDFIEGIKKHFVRVSYVFFEFYLSFFAFLFVMPLVIVPSVVIAKKAVENGNSNFLNTGLLSLVTGFVLVFITLLLLVNFVLRIPGIYYFDKKPIEKAKLVLTTRYWSVFGKVTLFVIALAMGEYLIFSLNMPVLEAILNFIFLSVYISLISVYMFYEFSTVLETLKKN
ncbi:MAG: hypothetical protein JXQ23_05830 [Clostridia bacterium]|nr:hypothetical protein [Clostridia bacterium]